MFPRKHLLHSASNVCVNASRLQGFVYPTLRGRALVGCAALNFYRDVDCLPTESARGVGRAIGECGQTCRAHVRHARHGHEVGHGVAYHALARP